ncbi:D-amino acid aminotransferase [Rhizobium sp. Root149]|uniref:D-amino-acid transaminase n=1 Tax=Rhizobium sp. Root149 TaxID=1736473 RepID=UPI0007136E12|nr:D-amino-acid transaminase [Rhizobium sp. Root149]KQZ47742.1 D-amino acid aminotransferase [Rhizobium sp. Root149]
MSRIVYVNGEWKPEAEATISVFDRGLLFADAIYEVTAVINRKLIDYSGHTARLKRSLEALGIPSPVSDDELLDLHRQIIERNDLESGLIYLQISRGAADRDFLFADGMKPSIIMFTQKKNVLENPKWETGLSVVTVPEGRWANRQIKTVQLLYSSMIKTEAAKAGADDVFLVEDGLITEASSSNVHIVTKDGVLVTRHLSNALLHGITRASVLSLAQGSDLEVEERAFSVAEVLSAAEVFITSASAFVMPVVRVDGRSIGDGKPGPVSRKLLQTYIQDCLAHAI